MGQSSYTERFDDIPTDTSLWAAMVLRIGIDLNGLRRYPLHWRGHTVWNIRSCSLVRADWRCLLIASSSFLAGLALIPDKQGRYVSRMSTDFYRSSQRPNVMQQQTSNAPPWEHQQPLSTWWRYTHFSSVFELRIISQRNHVTLTDSSRNSIFHRTTELQRQFCDQICTELIIPKQKKNKLRGP